MENLMVTLFFCSQPIAYSPLHQQSQHPNAAFLTLLISHCLSIKMTLQNHYHLMPWPFLSECAFPMQIQLMLVPSQGFYLLRKYLEVIVAIHPQHREGENTA
jgi:hypothetical protein